MDAAEGRDVGSVLSVFCSLFGVDDGGVSTRNLNIPRFAYDQLNPPPTGTGAAHERRVGTGWLTSTQEGKLEFGRQRHGSTGAWPR